MSPTDPIDTWLGPLIERHTRALSRPEFLKAARALSARYVERRAELTHRSPTDSAGKRAAFSAFFAPLHFLTTREIVRALDAASRPVSTVVDLGCGTGVAAAAWAAEYAARPALVGVDKETWALDEAAWNWRSMGLRGRTRRGDLVAMAQELSSRRRPDDRIGVVLGWSANELPSPERERLLPALFALAAGGSTVILIEPLSRAVTPWWNAWADTWQQHGGRADEWKFKVDLPPLLDDISNTAGFRRQELGARTLAIGLGA